MRDGRSLNGLSYHDTIAQGLRVHSKIAHEQPCVES